MERNLISLPCGATFTLLVSDDVEFLHGKLLPFAPDKAEEAVSAYQEMALGSKGIAGIGYEISFNNSKMEDKLHFFYPGEPEYEDGAMNGLCYREVRRAVERVVKLASVLEGERLKRPFLVSFLLRRE